MILCVDVGNTNISFGVFKGQNLIHKFDLSTVKSFTEFQFFAQINVILHHFGIDFKEITEVKIGSVVPEVERMLTECFMQVFKIPTRFIVKEDMKIKINLHNISEVGIDRLINVFSAFKKYGTEKNVLIIDFGTAVTFDIGLKSYEYDGGAIYPGIKLSLEALSHKTSKLPQVLLHKPTSPVGKTTSQAINVGIFYGYSGMVNSIVHSIKKEYDSEFRIILTGGLSNVLSDFFNFPFEMDETLNLYGILHL